MKEFIGYKHGVNLGGWLSQSDYSPKHLEEFITEEDVKRIAGWGCDHVRLPFDYNVILGADNSMSADAFKYLDRCVSWCESCGLNIILDLHKTPGFSFDKGENESGFFEDERYQEIFMAMWREIAAHYADKADHVAFELLNEITDRKYAAIWNSTAARTIRAIRAAAPDNYILIGGIYNNSIFGLTLLDKPCAENIVFNFHYYDPLVFTHQKAPWVDMMKPDCTVDYPDTKEIYRSKTLENLDSGLAQPFNDFGGDMIDASYMEWEMSAAVEVAEKLDVPIYCGEYGVIDRVPDEQLLRWYADVSATFDKLGIGRAAWTYREKDFGITDPCRAGIADKIVKLL
ncbi:MAG: glycoside hydrolase family 5 protein [Ruminococcus sp.]|nr:glycoside hydrolase family 5 protein [Ruminococcus sp.]